MHVIRSLWIGVRVLAVAVLLISSTSDVLRAQETAITPASAVM